MENNNYNNYNLNSDNKQKHEQSKVEDVSNQEKVVIPAEQEVNVPAKPPIYIRTLNVIVNPLRNRYERHYKESKKHLVIDIIFVFLILILIGLNIFVANLKYPVESIEIKINHPAVNGDTDELKPEEPIKPTVVDTNLSLNNQLIYHTTEGEQLGVGPWPPQVDSLTSIYVVWEIQTNLHPTSNTKIRAKLPTNVNYTGNIAVNQGQALEFDPATRQISWQIDKLETTSMARASFEIKLTPTADQETQKIKLLEDVVLSAFDSVTGNIITTFGKNLYSPAVVK